MKKKKILFIILPIILILIIGAVLAVLYFTTDMFKSSDALFAKYFSQNKNLLDIMKNPNTEEQKNFKTNNNYTMTGNLTTTVQDGSNTQEIIVETAGRHDANAGRTYSEMVLKNGEADVLKVSYINSGDVYAIKCDDIMANYIGFRNNELRKMAQNMGVSTDTVQQMPDSIDFTAINDMATITEEQKTHMIDTYSKVITESISSDKYTKSGKILISVDGTSYEANAYQVTIDGATLKQILINCLTTLKDDNITLVLISNKLSSLGIDTEYTDITKLSEAVGNLATQLQNETADNTNVIITVYENKGKTIRTEIELNTNKTETISSMANTTGEESAALSTSSDSNIKITIDKSENESTNNAVITITENENSNTQNAITGETNETTPTANAAQIILQKTVTEENATNSISIIPDANNTAQSVTMSTTLGKLANGTISNSSNASISISSDGINVQTVDSTYTQNIQAATEVDEIMELKNSNTIIFNNYTSAQLTPFLTQIGEKIEQVVPNKIGQLGVDLSSNSNGENNNQTGTTNLINVSNNIIKTLQIIGTAGVSVANANGIDTVGIGTTVVRGVRIYTYNQILDRTQESQEKMQEMQEQESVQLNQMMQNIESTIGQ